MKSLPSIIVVIVDTVNYGKAVHAMQKTLEQIKPAKAIWFTDIPYPTDQFEVVQIPTIKTIEEYSRFMLKELWGYLPEIPGPVTHILTIQHDGYVLDGEQWDDDFLNFSWLGAPWPRTDKYRVGNGGFSLRSVGLVQYVAEYEFIQPLNPEDNTVAILYRDYLEERGFRWPPESLAHRFSFELYEPRVPTFGFHNYHHEPFKPYIVIRREGAMGDCVALEPVLAWYHDHGYNVVLDSPYYDLYAMHRFKVRSYEHFDKSIPHKRIGLDKAYEVSPAQLHLKSYFECCGIQDYVLRNSELNYNVPVNLRLFKKYVVIHIDDRETTHRNVYGIDWVQVRKHLESQGFTVIQIGRGVAEEAGHYFNTVSTSMLLWLIAGSEFVIAVDSGPANIAVALKKKCILFFGSVNPEYIYPDRSLIKVMQSDCPFNKRHCWHSTTSERGSDCQTPEMPPCCVHDTTRLIELIDQI